MRRKEALAPRSLFANDPFATLRQMASEFDRMFDESMWPSLSRPLFGSKAAPESISWLPQVDVFERNGRLITRIDLPGMKKEDVNIEVTDGQLTISGERKRETEETKENFYRAEREYGNFYRAFALPEGITFEDVKATFANGVLEVSVPMPVQKEAKVRKVEIAGAEKLEPVGV